MDKNYDLFEDRARSLLTRWKRFHDNNPDVPDIDSRCIKGFLSEIDDDYTKELLKGKEE